MEEIRLTTWDVQNPANKWDKLPTSTGERRISSINNMFTNFPIGTFCLFGKPFQSHTFFFLTHKLAKIGNPIVA